MTTKQPAAKTKLTNKKPIGLNKEQQAKVAVSSSLMNAAAAEPFAKILFPEIDINDLTMELKGKIGTVNDGDMSGMEAMLVGQAQTLQTIFTSLTRRAASQEYVKNYGLFMNLALKAQAQSRATIQALIELKYPKQVSFVKQANFSNGHQQINNGDNSHAKKNEIDKTNY